MDRSAVTGFVVVAFMGSSATVSAQTFRLGEITFTQGGHEVTWQLSHGDLRNIGGLLATLQYTPDGTSQNSSAPRFDLGFHKSGAIVSIVTLAVQQGPAGDGLYRSGKALCTLRITRMDVLGVEGTGTCSGGFEGTTVSKLTFSARNPRLGRM